MAFDLYQHVTDTIIKTLEDGTPPWRQPWSGGATGFPTRGNGEFYQGINVLLLWAAAQEHGFASDRWLTYRQAQQMGAQVRRGEKSSLVVYYGTLEHDGDKDKAGAEEDVTTIPYLKSYRVFNADQIDGLPEGFYSNPIDHGTKPVAAHTEFFAATGADIRVGGNQAFYAPSTDHIQIPPIEWFETAESFYGVLAHELTHWTGASNRLDRDKKYNTTEGRAFEELIAEIGSVFIASKIGAEPDFGQSAAYVENWLKALKDDKRFIFKAASAAQKAATYVFDVVENAGLKQAS